MIKYITLINILLVKKCMNLTLLYAEVIIPEQQLMQRDMVGAETIANGTPEPETIIRSVNSVTVQQTIPVRAIASGSENYHCFVMMIVYKIFDQCDQCERLN